jgi:hypothetical protein
MAEQPPTNACYRKSGYDKLIKKIIIIIKKKRDEHLVKRNLHFFLSIYYSSILFSSITQTSETT